MIQPITLKLTRKLARALLALAFLVAATGLAAQNAPHDMSRMGQPAPAAPLLGAALARTGSGTSWLPDSSPERMLHVELGDWMVMLHGAGFGMFDRQWTLHGDTRWGVLDWEMATAARPLAGGLFRLTAMTSLESLFLPDTGYPQLLQSGETFQFRRVANTEHAHGLVGELSASYDYLLTSKLSSSLYVAAVGEPALGPVAYRHRPSAAADPFAPLGQHWQDASHGDRGVVTAGLYTSAIKLEGSAFNGREPVDNQLDLDFKGARLDSYSGRLTVLPAAGMAVAAWAGYLADHDPLDPGTPMQRYGASVLTEGRGLGGGSFSTALVWGLNNHHHGVRAHDHEATKQLTHHMSSSVLIEATLGLGTRTELFARAEQVQKTADDLGFLGGNLMEAFNVRALTLGATRDVVSAGRLAIAVGARGTVNLLPQTLNYTYTTTHPAGFVLFLRARPVAAR